MMAFPGYPGIADGNPWFVAKDVCDILEYADPNVALKGLDDDEKLLHQIDGTGQRRKMLIINESGLYTLILRSNKPAAKPFRKWVTAEVLPAIRKTGSYQQPGADPNRPETLLIVAREFRAAVRIARAAGLRDTEAVMAADKLTNELTGFSPVALLNHDVTKLPEEAL
ncbi:Bro-N domain-containing protein [Neptuniibacter sp.]|uniref:BRO-N domain-containing protein n=1 Tax=Neptuniibacter sp. TaxID=1962643 RepID=UPI00261C728B|nr:Bro-N domain-containing protein [Neptuniibacter sp.]MCP4594973.1 Bro-N domain-containing protein [Neptuniibacter sp.]